MFCPLIDLVNILFLLLGEKKYIPSKKNSLFSQKAQSFVNSLCLKKYTLVLVKMVRSH